LSEMPQILAKIGLETDELPDHSTLVKAFDRIEMRVWRALGTRCHRFDVLRP
jgi:IS5 family transposase